MAKNNPLISILVCNFNYDRYIRETLDSIRAQDYRNLEIIIIDDGSEDNSVSVVKEYMHEYPETTIHLKAKTKNEGVCYARNDAIDLAKGEYILFLDSDDTIPSGYVSSMYKTSAEQNADVVYGDVRKFGDETGETDYPEFIREKLLLYNFVNISSLVKKASLGEHRFDVKLNKKTLEDYDFWLGLALKGLHFVKVKDAYLNYRIQDKSRNENSLTPDKRILQFIDIWKYSVKKYSALYGGVTYENIIEAELEYRVKEIGQELSGLNKVVQQELLPELKTRADHIAQLDERIEEVKKLNEILEETLEHIRNSLSHRIGQALKKPARIIKKALKK
jgi:glycosyltransferase involved in cell wall biosynthesis